MLQYWQIFCFLSVQIYYLAKYLVSQGTHNYELLTYLFTLIILDSTKLMMKKLTR